MTNPTEPTTSTIEYRGNGVWVAVLDQDAMENIAHYLPYGARHSVCNWAQVHGLAQAFQDALESAFPDDAQDPASHPACPCPFPNGPCTCTNGIGCTNVPVEEW